MDIADVLAVGGAGCPLNCSNHGEGRSRGRPCQERAARSASNHLPRQRTLHLAGTCGPSGRCLCDRYFAPPACGVDYMAAVGSWPYDLVFGIETTAMIICASITLWSLLRHRCCMPSSERTSMLSLCSNERELAALANLIACVVRPFWFLSFGEAATAEGVFVNNVVDAVLLRVPQCAWMTAYLFMILAWRSIILSADNQTVSWTFRGLVAFAGIAVDAIALPLAIYSRSSVDAPEYLHSVGNGITAVAAALLFFGGVFTVWSLRRRIQILELEMTGAHIHGDAEVAAPPDDAKASQVFAAIHSTFRQVTFASAIALLLIVAVAVSAAPIADPGKHPDVYFAFVVIVHCVVESFTAFQIAMLTFPRSVTTAAAGGDDDEAELAAAQHGAYVDAGAYDGFVDGVGSYTSGVDARPSPSPYADSEPALADLAQDSFIGNRFG